MKIIYLYLLMLPMTLLGQGMPKFLSSASSIEMLNYDSLLKEMATTSDIVGLGEATHGTSEFALIKNEIIKSLILNYNYKHIILELGYADCTMINNYIRFKKSNLRSARIGLFNSGAVLYYNNELIELIEWLRIYNLNKTPLDQVYIYGMDLNFKMTKYHVKLFNIYDIDTFVYNRLIQFDVMKNRLSKKEKLNLAKELTNHVINHSYKSPKDSLMLINDIERINTNILKSKNWYPSGKGRAHRENVMFNNVKRIKKYFVSKGQKIIISAHNGHIIKDTKRGRMLGYKLKKEYSYSAIGFDFLKGDFHSFDNDTIVNQKKWTLRKFSISTNSNTLAHNLDRYNLGVLFVDLNQKNQLLNKYETILSIGNSFSESMAKKEIHKRRICIKNAFDALIVLKKSSPTNTLYYHKF